MLFDTNFLLLPGQKKIDVVEEIKRIIPSAEPATTTGVLAELEKVKDSAAAKIAIMLVKLEKIRVIEDNDNPDAALPRIALENNAIVATNDKILKKRCVQKGVRVAFMRKQKTIETI